MFHKNEMQDDQFMWFIVKQIQTYMRFFLLWRTKDDILNSVSMFLLQW